MIALLLNISKNISELNNDCNRKFVYRTDAHHRHGPGNCFEGWILKWNIVSSVGAGKATATKCGSAFNLMATAGAAHLPQCGGGEAKSSSTRLSIIAITGIWKSLEIPRLKKAISQLQSSTWKKCTQNLNKTLRQLHYGQC